MSRRALPPAPHSFSVGDVVDAYWEEDDQWFDGMIEGLPLDDGTIKVRYTDYDEVYDVPIDWVQARVSPTKQPVKKSAPVPAPRPRAQTSDTAVLPAHARPPPDSVRGKTREQRRALVNHGKFAQELMSRSQKLQKAGISMSSRAREVANRELQVLAAEAADWTNTVLGKTVCKVDESIDMAEEFVSNLCTGIELCVLVQRVCDEHRPEIARKCKVSLTATPGSFKARDNIHHFIAAAEAIGVPQVSLFETEDVVKVRQHRRIIDCILKMAKLAVQFGVRPPRIVQMELELDKSEDDDPHANANANAPDKKPTVAGSLAKSKHAMDRNIAQVIADHGIDNVDVCRVPNRKDYYYFARKGKLNTRDAMMVAIRKVRSCLLVRVGGGWLDFVEFVERRIDSLPKQVGVSRKSSAKKLSVGKGVTASSTTPGSKVMKLKKTGSTPKMSGSNRKARKTPTNGVRKSRNK